MEQTFSMLKPNTIFLGLTGEIIQRIERAKFKIVALKMVTFDRKLAEEFYKEHVGKPFFESLIEFITSGPVVAMIVEGVDAIENVRKLCGVTESKSALPGTIRGDFSHVSYSYADKKEIAIRNIVHASGNKDDAELELALWFSIDEIHNYKISGEEHLFWKK